MCPAEWDGKVSTEGFRYISLSMEAFQAIEEPASIAVGGDVQRDFGLMQGFLTVPYLNVFRALGGTSFEWYDPYRDITDPDSTSYWTKDNDPQCVE